MLEKTATNKLNFSFLCVTKMLTGNILKTAEIKKLKHKTLKQATASIYASPKSKLTIVGANAIQNIEMKEHAAAIAIETRR